MFYLAVVFAEGNIIDRRLDAQNQAKLVVDLDRDRPHVVFDPRAFDAHVESVAHLPLVIARQFLPQKRGHVVGLDGVDSRAREVPIKHCQIRPAAATPCR
jgi:hypothetical protein